MITEIPTSLCINNIKHVKIIRATLKTYKTYANKIHYQIDHDFRNLTELVWHFYEFSMIYNEFPSIQPIIKITKHRCRVHPLVDSTRPELEHGAPATCADAQDREAPQ